MKVEVELEDLEKVVFATSAIKVIESALTMRKNDPFVKPHLVYNDALNNLITAMTHAKRSKEAYATPWDGDLSKAEIEYLRVLKMKDRRYGGFDTVTGRDRMDHPEIDSLVAKGCARMGTMCSGVIWSGESQPSLQKLPEFAVNITPRGNTKLEEALMKRAEKAGLLNENDHNIQS